ncbi:unnamed protein product [Sphagnum balticum]
MQNWCWMKEEKTQVSFCHKLQAATRSVQWTYAIFWEPSPKQQALVWGNGYYNGSIKTRRTVHAEELSPEEFGLQRTQQLRDLFATLSVAGTGHELARKPSSLNPEDLAETEWFYLVCMSCSFASGAGLPGRTMGEGRYVWLYAANEANTKVFNRALLAKTVVCIPLADGVLELGTTDLVKEDPTLVQHILSFFADHMKSVSTEQSASSHQGPEKSELLERQGTTGWLSSPVQNSPSKSSAQETPVLGFTQESDAEGQSILLAYEFAFVHWEDGLPPVKKYQQPGNHQRLLKEAMFHITKLCSTRGDDSKEGESGFASLDTEQEERRSAGGSRKGGGSAEEVNGSHVLAERRRREKLNDRFITLRALVPFVTKMDKASILGDAIDYVKELQRRIKDLEAQNNQLHEVVEARTAKRPINMNKSEMYMDNQPKMQFNDKLSTIEQTAKAGDPTSTNSSLRENGQEVPGDADVEVSIEGDEAILNLKCPWRKNLLLDILQTLSNLQFDVFAVQASTGNDHLAASLKAKMRNDATLARPNVLAVQETLQHIVGGVGINRNIAPSPN